jgi:hypothetical protein
MNMLPPAGHPGRARAAAALAAACAALCAACATVAPRNIELEDARSAFAQARSHPFADQAGAQLERAQQSLAQAEAGWDASTDADATNRRAYVARLQAQIALAVATQAGEAQRLAQAQHERARLLLLLHSRATGPATPPLLISDVRR